MNQQFFDEVLEFPDHVTGKRYEALVGLDAVKERLLKEAEIQLKPDLLLEWSKKTHKDVIPLTKIFENRNSFFIFAGDVGTGKTTLAESFGEKLAQENKISIILYKLSLNTRGNGNVGEMTHLLSTAFQEIREHAKQNTKTIFKLF